MLSHWLTLICCYLHWEYMLIVKLSRNQSIKGKHIISVPSHQALANHIFLLLIIQADWLNIYFFFPLNWKCILGENSHRISLFALLVSSPICDVSITCAVFMTFISLALVCNLCDDAVTFVPHIIHSTHKKQRQVTAAQSIKKRAAFHLSCLSYFCTMLAVLKASGA